MKKLLYYVVLPAGVLFTASKISKVTPCISSKKGHSLTARMSLFVTQRSAYQPSQKRKPIP